MAKTDKDDALKRLGGGRWQTRDERFTIEPQGGTWVVVDGEQTDDLGLSLVRGPFGSLREAKEAIDGARQTEPAESPLNARVAQLRSRPRSAKPASTTRATKPAKAEDAGEPAEPRWLTDLGPAKRRRARQLVSRLAELEAPDPEGIVRRDLLGNVPTTAAYAIQHALGTIRPGAPPATIARLLADGRDDELGVRWRLVDDHGRPITLDLDAIDAG